MTDRKRFRDHIAPHPSLSSALDSAARPSLEKLDARLRDFYNSPVTTHYFETAEAGNSEWLPEMKGHQHLKQAIPRGSRVVDLGCGTAHPYRNLADLDVDYTGVDWSAKQIDHNRREMPDASFVAASLYETGLPEAAFDVAISLYAIEHLVWPHLLLREMIRLARPGGLIGLLFPPFRSRSYLKSFDYGLSARPIREKVMQGRLLDAAIHVYQHRLAYPWLLARSFPPASAENRFLIHLEPVCLTRQCWFPDADAVYLADAREIVDYLEESGCCKIESWERQGYVLARKSA